MRIDWDTPIEMPDGLILRADVYRPIEDKQCPVLISYGPYGKLLTFQKGYADQWERMIKNHPDVPSGSSNKYQNWEVVDPELWVPDDYAVVRVDSRGSGRSPGFLNVWSSQEADDFAACIEWAAEQSWSNGKVGLNGISYYAMNQWQVATRDPKGLEAMCIWEGASDWYRDLAYHGGIYCTFAENWYDMQVKTVQNGVGENGYQSEMNGKLVAGPSTLTEEELGSNRADISDDMRSNQLVTSDYWSERNPDWSSVKVPLLSSANWGGQGLHTRGNFEGYMQAASDSKWLEVHGDEHWTEFYTDYGVNLQKRFFDYYLKDEPNDWEQQPKVQMQIRRPGEVFEQRYEDDWPIPRTDWTRFYLDSQSCCMSREASLENNKVTYRGLGDGVTFITEPQEDEVEITGPISANLFIESDTVDADMFLTVRVFDSNFKEVTFQGALDEHTPIAQGWLRASHRKLDHEKSTEWRPYHTHDEEQPLNPGEIYDLNIEIWPTSIVVPPTHRLALTVRGKDYEYPGDVEGGLESMKDPFTGVGPFKHDASDMRPPDIFDNNVTIHTGTEHPSSILLPIIPKS